MRVASKVVQQWPSRLVMVLTMVMMLVPLLSVAVGASKVQAVPCSMVLLVLLHVMIGAVVSTTVTLLLNWARRARASVSFHARAVSKVVPQRPAMLVAVLTMVIVLV